LKLPLFSFILTSGQCPSVFFSLGFLERWTPFTPQESTPVRQATCFFQKSVLRPVLFHYFPPPPFLRCVARFPPPGARRFLSKSLLVVPLLLSHGFDAFFSGLPFFCQKIFFGRRYFPFLSGKHQRFFFSQDSCFILGTSVLARLKQRCSFSPCF